jgi:hypothetical protein
MIKVTIIMDEEKIKEKSDLSVEETYKRIDSIAKEVGITKKEGFNYIGDENTYCWKFYKFWSALDKCSSWFFDFIDTWTYEDNVEFVDFKMDYIEEGLIKTN